MEFIWILFAYACGLGARTVTMPPLIGYLIAGFALHALGYQLSDTLQAIADLGITLMLFTIGLKLDPAILLRREVWAGTLGHIGTWMIASMLSMTALALAAGFGLFSDADMRVIALLAFAGCFSSTVCVLKALEDNGDVKTRHGRLAIAILVMQDIIAVMFLVAVTGRTPSLWALALPLIFFLRPLVNRLLQSAGHGELLPLTGFFLALGAYELFEVVNVKGDLGALLAGILLSQYSKSAELTKSLMSFKDLFLIGFFLSIGFSSLPDADMLGTALLLVLLLPVKFVLLFLLLVALRLRARSAYLTSLALSNFSEFGLIVAATSTRAGWLDDEWLATLAVAVAISFMISTLLYKYAHSIYIRFKPTIKLFERRERLPQDVPFQPQSAEVLIIGLGRVGRGAYDALADVMGDRVWGMDADRRQVQKREELGKQVFVGDGEDADFWENFDHSCIRMVLMALPTIDDAINTTKQIRRTGYTGLIAGIARYEDESQRLTEGGVDKVFNFFTGAGAGFAEESLETIRTLQPGSTAQPLDEG